MLFLKETVGKGSISFVQESAYVFGDIFFLIIRKLKFFFEKQVSFLAFISLFQLSIGYFLRCLNVNFSTQA